MLLLLLVFALVNISVLVLKRRPVDHPHFTTPRWAAALGAVTSLLLASPLSGFDRQVYGVAAILVGVGIVLWFLNRLISGKPTAELDPEKLVK